MRTELLGMEEQLIFVFVLLHAVNCSVGQYTLRSYQIKARTNSFFTTAHLKSYQNPRMKPTWCASQCIDFDGSCKAFTFNFSRDTRQCILHSRPAEIGDSDLVEMNGSFYYDMKFCLQEMPQGDENCQVGSTTGVFTTSSAVSTTRDVTTPITVSSTEQTSTPSTFSTTILSTTIISTNTPTTLRTTEPTTKETTMQTSEPMTSKVTTSTTSIPSTSQTTIEPSTKLQTTEGVTTQLGSTIPPVLYGDCYDIFHTGGITESGVYKILLDNGLKVDVFCDMDTDGGGWTVIQRRQDGSVDFYRYWNEYAQGFGNLGGEFWLGNNAIYMLTFNDDVQLRFDLVDFDDAHNVAVYDNFRIQDETGFFQLSLGTRIQGLTAGDSMQHHNGRKFSTRDQDNDNQNNAESCAQKFRGGWWYGSCMRANLNGLYLDDPHGPYPTGYHYGLAWYYWHGTHAYSLKRTEMKIRKKLNTVQVLGPAAFA